MRRAFGGLCLYRSDLEDDFANCELKARWLFWRRGRADRLSRFEPPLPRRAWWKSYSTCPPSTQSELFDTALENCRAQTQQMPGAPHPPKPPPRPSGMRAYEAPAWSHHLGSFSSDLNIDRLVIGLKPADGKMTVPQLPPHVLRYFCTPSRANNESTGRW